MAISNISNGEQANSVRTKLNSTINQVNTNTTNISTINNKLPQGIMGYSKQHMGWDWVEDITSTAKAVMVCSTTETLIGMLVLVADSNYKFAKLNPYMITEDLEGTSEFTIYEYSTNFYIKPNKNGFTVRCNKSSSTNKIYYFPFIRKD